MTSVEPVEFSEEQGAAMLHLIDLELGRPDGLVNRWPVPLWEAAERLRAAGFANPYPPTPAEQQRIDRLVRMSREHLKDPIGWWRRGGRF